MKPYETYQQLKGDVMTERDKKQIGSKFWNRGKWDNFVKPLLPEDGKGMTFIDMGGNAGLFCSFAQEHNFRRIICVDSNKGAIDRGKAWRDKNGYKYDLIHSKMEDVIDELPVADYTILVNAHYYFHIIDWVKYLDRIRYKSKNVIVVTAHKNHINRCWPLTDLVSVRRYFKDWEETGFVDELSREGDPDPRRLWGLRFESQDIEQVDASELDTSNNVQSTFYKEIDSGVPLEKTEYYKILRPYRTKWSKEKLVRWLEEKIALYEDVKKGGQREPLLIGPKGWVMDGNHRYMMLKTIRRKIWIRRI